MQRCGGEIIQEKGKRNSPRTRRNGRYEDSEEWPAEEPALPHKTVLKSQPVLVLRAMSGSQATQQRGSALMSVAHVPPKGYADVPGLGCHLEPC